MYDNMPRYAKLPISASVSLEMPLHAGKYPICIFLKKYVTHAIIVCSHITGIPIQVKQPRMNNIYKWTTHGQECQNYFFKRLTPLLVNIVSVFTTISSFRNFCSIINTLKIIHICITDPSTVADTQMTPDDAPSNANSFAYLKICRKRSFIVPS